MNMNEYTKYAALPLKQYPNRVWRTYSGGLLLDRFRHNPSATDSSTPEEWVMSTVTARGDNRPPQEGLSRIVTHNGEQLFLSNLIQSAPEAFLGKNRAEMGVLIKLLDASERLTIQVHPDKTFAREELHSGYGKTEGWYILSAREIDGEDGYVLIGFKEGVTRRKWAELFHSQNIEGMLNALHKIPVKEGDVFIVHGGVPHAIGGGCFMVEIQEPTDYTMRVEKTTPRGLPVGDFLIHQGIGEEKMLDCFRYETASLPETLTKWKAEPLLLADTAQAQVYSLLDSRYTDCFTLEKISMQSTSYTLKAKDSFYILICINGDGLIQTNAGGSTPIRQGESFFLPAGIGDITLQTDTDLQLLVCLPPHP
jgi:mannose-6-phosphate isomerase